MPSHTFIKPAYAVTAGDQLFRGGRVTAASSRPRWAVMRPLLALVATLLLVAVVPASASASMEPGEPVADPNVDAWLAIAQSWRVGAPDCPGGVHVDRAARVAGDDVWASVEMPGCHISLDPDFYPRPAAWSASPWARGEWQRQMCNIVVHEWGHRLGSCTSGAIGSATPMRATPTTSWLRPSRLVVADCRKAASSGRAAPRAASKPKKAKRSRGRAGKPRRAAARGSVTVR